MRCYALSHTNNVFFTDGRHQILELVGVRAQGLRCNNVCPAGTECLFDMLCTSLVIREAIGEMRIHQIQVADRNACEDGAGRITEGRAVRFHSILPEQESIDHFQRELNCTIAALHATRDITEWAVSKRSSSAITQSSPHQLGDCIVGAEISVVLWLML